MKEVAICFSGLFRGNAKQNVRRIYKAFGGADCFFEAWEADDLPDWVTPVKPPRDVFPRYEWDYDREIFDHDPKYESPSDGKSNLQHWAHAHIVKNLPDKYEFVIRARYDCFIDLDQDWMPYINLARKYGLVVGTGDLKPSHYPNWRRRWFQAYYGSDQDPYWDHSGGYGLSDAFIFHRRCMLDCDRVFEQYEREELRIGERGWWQILVENNYGFVRPWKDPSQNYTGGCVLDKYL